VSVTVGVVSMSRRITSSGGSPGQAARLCVSTQPQLADVDLPGRRLIINGHTRRLDEVTAILLDRYLADRQRRWPHTLNRHLFLSEQTGHDQRPVSDWWLDKPQ
jgi:hypothetical protein